jgi:hypothetical protein
MIASRSTFRAAAATIEATLDRDRLTCRTTRKDRTRQNFNMYLNSSLSRQDIHHRASKERFRTAACNPALLLSSALFIIYLSLHHTTAYVTLASGVGLDGQPGLLFRNLTTDKTGIPATVIAEDMKNNPAKYNWAPTEAIVLAVCYGAKGGYNSVAVIFASVLGVKVYATPFLAIITPDSSLAAGPPTNPNTPPNVIPNQIYSRDWKIFMPPK